MITTGGRLPLVACLEMLPVTVTQCPTTGKTIVILNPPDGSAKRWHGLETVPQRRSGDRATTATVLQRGREIVPPRRSRKAKPGRHVRTAVPSGPVPLAEGAGYVGSIPGGKALRFTHRGPYQDLMKTYGRITELVPAKGLLKNEADWARYMSMWEEYVNDPGTTPEADPLTYIYLPLP